MIKSPFLVIEDFLSPLDCEIIVEKYGNSLPDCNDKGVELKTILPHPLYENRIWNKLSDYFEYIESYYSVEIESLSKMHVEWYPEGCPQEPVRCENSIYTNKKWSITNKNDFTVIIFLKSFNSSKNFDTDFECYGGKLEFPNHNFGFTPIRGTAIIFPSNQYFLNATKSPEISDMFQARLHITCEKRFQYSPKSYEGNYTTWFK